MVTNDIYTTEDADFLRRAGVLDPARIQAVQTGCCPHTAIRDDIAANLDAVEDLEDTFGPLDLVLVESGGDNLTATFSHGLVDRQIFVLDVSGGDKVPRKGGPGVTTSDLLLINKIDLAPLVGASLEVMDRDAAAVRQGRPVIFSSLREDPQASAVTAWVRAALAERGHGFLRAVLLVRAAVMSSAVVSSAVMRAVAELVAEAGPGRFLRLPVQRSQAPLVLRRTADAVYLVSGRPPRSAGTRSNCGSRSGPGPPCGCARSRRRWPCPAVTARNPGSP